MENQTKKQKLVNLKILPKIHTRIYSMVYPGDGKKAFTSAGEVIAFLFQQYDEKVKEKILVAQNRTPNIKEDFFKIKEAFENSLSPEELKKYWISEARRITERFR